MNFRKSRIVLMCVMLLGGQSSLVFPSFSQIDKKELLFAFDLHGVLMAFDSTKLLSVVGGGVLTTGAVAKYCGLKTAAFLAGIPCAVWGVFGIWYFFYKKFYGHSPSVESFLEGNGFLKSLIRRGWLFFANMFKPNSCVFDYAWQLKKAGYRLILSSNVGKESLNELKKAYSTFFWHGNVELFDAYFHPGACWVLSEEDSKRLQHGWLVKSNPVYFDGFKLFLKNNGFGAFKKIVLVDDNARFVERARHDELFNLAVHFSGVENLAAEVSQKIGWRPE